MLETDAVITDAHKQTFRQEGYMILERVIPEDMLQMLRTGCEHQQRLDLGRQLPVVPFENPASHALAQWRAARLARGDDLETSGADQGRDKCQIRRLADSFDPFKSDERALH
jgi:hypothetical protein